MDWWNLIRQAHEKPVAGEITAIDPTWVGDSGITSP